MSVDAGTIGDEISSISFGTGDDDEDEREWPR